MHVIWPGQWSITKLTAVENVENFQTWIKVSFIFITITTNYLTDPDSDNTQTATTGEAHLTSLWFQFS